VPLTDKSRSLKIAYGVASLTVLTGGALGILLALPPIRQSDQYHNFADQRTIWGIPNLWNVASNAAFLIAAAAGVRSMGSSQGFSQEWERHAYRVLNAAVAMTAFGSAYYHLHPNSRTLFWDRLPMTLVFTSILAMTIGERISMNVGRRSLLPLLVTGIASVLYWRYSGDLRWYGLVQFVPMLVVPLLLIFFPPRYSRSTGVWWMIGLYLLAKGAELFDRQIGGFIPTGGHPWKHLAGAAAMACYASDVARRRILPLAATVQVEAYDSQA